MPSTSVAVSTAHQPASTPPAKLPHGNTRIPRNIAAAIDVMIEEGKPWNEAAEQSNVSVRTMRLAMQRPHVISYLKARREVFRVNACAGNIHRLAKLADQEDNKAAAVSAIKAMEQIGENEAATGGRIGLPGLQIVIVQHGNAPPAMTIEHGSVLTSEPSD